MKYGGRGKGTLCVCVCILYCECVCTCTGRLEGLRMAIINNPLHVPRLFSNPHVLLFGSTVAQKQNSAEQQQLVYLEALFVRVFIAFVYSCWSLSDRRCESLKFLFFLYLLRYIENGAKKLVIVQERSQFQTIVSWVKSFFTCVVLGMDCLNPLCLNVAGFCFL